MFLITPTYEWQFAQQVERDADFTKDGKKAGLGPEVARLLFERVGTASKSFQNLHGGTCMTLSAP